MKRLAGRAAVVAFALCLCWIQASSAMTAPSPTYRARAEQLVRILTQPGGETEFFSTLFLEAVPLAQWRAIAEELRTQHGRPVALGAVRMESDTTGQVEIRYRHATVGFSLVVAPQEPGKVIGLHIVGVATAGDTLDKVASELRALPGRTAMAIARLRDGGPQWLLPASAGDASMAVGSSYKLYILAELARAVAAGERRWSDVVPLGPKSFSGRLLGWPDGAPITVHSLATAMISESDNSASDTLMLALGRDRVDAMVFETGHAMPDRALPLLTSAEAFALKMPGNADLLALWRGGSNEARHALLRDAARRLGAQRVDIGTVAETPNAIDSAEWFASPRDMIALMHWLRHHGGDALSIMAVNPGIAPADAKRWRYIGYKGGSEPGVMAMSFLVQRQDGAWFSVSAAWNDPKARLDEGRFVALMTRTLNLLAAGADYQDESVSPKPTERNSGTGPFHPSSGPSSASNRR